MKNRDNNAKIAGLLGSVGELNDEFILEAAPTFGRAGHYGSKRGLIAAAALMGAAAAAVLAFVFFGGRGKPDAPVKEASASFAPTVTDSAGEPQDRSGIGIISLGAIKSATEFDNYDINEAMAAAENGDVRLQPGSLPRPADRVRMFTHGDEWEPPAPQEVFGGGSTVIFRGIVTEVQNYTLRFDRPGSVSAFHSPISTVSFLVDECCKGDLKKGDTATVFMTDNIGGDQKIEPLPGEKDSGLTYYKYLRPGTEVIIVVEKNYADEYDRGWPYSVSLRNSDGTETELLYEFHYEDVGAGYKFIIPWDGKIFFEADGEFFYDVDVYDQTMLGENPTMDSAESFIKGVLAGMEL